MSWHYGIIFTKDSLGGNCYNIHEVFEDSKGKLSWTVNPVDPFGETVDEIRECIARMMLHSFKFPVYQIVSKNGKEILRPLPTISKFITEKSCEE